MTIRTAAAALALATLTFVSAAGLRGQAQTARSETMPVSEIKPGMVGVGRTVFEGAELSEFTVHILGVLRNIQGPKNEGLGRGVPGLALPLGS